MADYAERFLNGQGLPFRTFVCIREEKMLCFGIRIRVNVARCQNTEQVLELVHGSVIVKYCLYGIMFIEQP